MSRLLGRLLLAACLTFAAAGPRLALAQPIQSGQKMKIQASSDPLKNIVEWVVVVAMLGAALFVVCRSSRRG